MTATATRTRKCLTSSLRVEMLMPNVLIQRYRTVKRLVAPPLLPPFICASPSLGLCLYHTTHPVSTAEPQYLLSKSFI
jgi:hypothetical protein